jgi:hypothetical protein
MIRLAGRPALARLALRSVRCTWSVDDLTILAYCNCACYTKEKMKKYY